MGKAKIKRDKQTWSCSTDKGVKGKKSQQYIEQLKNIAPVAFAPNVV